MTIYRPVRVFLLLALPGACVVAGSPLQEIALRPLAAIWILLWTAAGACYRPGGRGFLGAGSAGMLLALFTLGPASAVWLATLSRLLGLGAHLMLQGRTQETRASALAELEELGSVALAVWLSTQWESQELTGQALRAGTVYLTTLGALSLLPRRLTSIRDRFRALAFDLGPDIYGCLVGGILAVAVPYPWALALLALVQLPVLEAARQNRLRQGSRQRRDRLEQVRRAEHRMSTTPSDPEEAALQIYRECRRAFSPGYFHLEILGGELEGTSFVAGSQEEFHQGVPKPPSYPPKRPGIHRRAEWQVLHSILEVKNTSLARIQLWCDPRKLGRDAAELFESLVPHMADALNFALLGRDASRDALTGLALRRELESRLHSAFTRRRRSDRAQSVLIVDLDKFKSVNDTWGHAAGDRVLVAVAEAIKQELREADLAARFGGEEFALFLEGSHGRAALEIADRIRQTIESLTLEWEGQTFSVTASVGAASIPELYVHSGHDLLALADEALYHAKRQGRNRCFLYQGKNRCLDPQGREHTFGDVPKTEAPRIFA